MKGTMVSAVLIPVILGLILSGCQTAGSPGPSSRADRETTSGKSIQGETPSAAEERRQRTERAPSAGSEEGKTPAPRVRQQRETPSKSPAQPSAQPAEAPLQVFKDYRTGLAFHYRSPWYIVNTTWDGPNLGKEGRSHMSVRFTTLTTDKKNSSQPGFMQVAGNVGQTVANTLQSIFGGGSGGSKKTPDPLDVLLTAKHFPYLKVEQRFRGNDGRTIVQTCRQGNLPDPVSVFHLFEEDQVASFAVQNFGSLPLRLEMQEMVASTHKP